MIVCGRTDRLAAEEEVLPSLMKNKIFAKMIYLQSYNATKRNEHFVACIEDEIATDFQH